MIYNYPRGNDSRFPKLQALHRQKWIQDVVDRDRLSPRQIFIKSETPINHIVLIKILSVNNRLITGKPFEQDILKIY